MSISPDASDQSTPVHEKPLQSWKEIAAYLERDVRTARRWEQLDGLPVRRRHAGPRSSVYAYPSEIEAWRARREPRAARPPDVSRWKRYSSVLAVAGAVSLALAWVFLGPILSPSDPLVEASDDTTRLQIGQIWTGEKVDFHGSVSPNGRLISYVDWETPNGPNLAVHDLASGQDRLVTRNVFRETPGFPVYSIFSPDSSEIAYTWSNRRQRLHELRIVSADGEEDDRPFRIVYRASETPDVKPEAWFPDGRRILAQIGRKDQTNQIVAISIEDGSMQVIKSIEWRWPENMSLSPDGGYIVYNAAPTQGDPQRDIYLLAADGSWEKSLITHPGDEAWAGWSPDGKGVLFLSDRTGSVSLWSARVAERRIVDRPRLVKREVGPVRMLNEALSGAGDLYFGSNSGLRDLFMAEVDWQSKRALTDPTQVRLRVEGSVVSHGWSPDGRYLAYLSRGGNETDTSQAVVPTIREFETGAEQILESDIELDSGRPRWSPSGMSILMTGYDARRRAGLYQIDPKNGRSQLVVRASESSFAGHGWSADGKAVIYREHASGGFRIVLAPLTGDRPQILYEREKARPGQKRLTIAADGSWLAFTENDGGAAVIKLINMAGGEVRELIRVNGAAMTVGGTFESTPDSRFLIYGNRVAGESGTSSELWLASIDTSEVYRLDLTAEGLDGLTFRPGGRQVTFTTGRSAQELWAIQNLDSVLGPSD